MWDKLKHEWKTLALAVAGLLVAGYDIIATNQLDWIQIVPEQFQKYALFLFPFLMLALRRWRNRELDK